MSITGVAIDLAATAQATGGVPVAMDGAPPGSLVDAIGQLQYGDTLFGANTTAGWRELQGWRSLAAADVADTPRPLAHGSYAGQVYAQSLVVTFTFLVRGLPDDKLAALATIESATRMDGVDRPLVVNDGDGPWLRMARVIARDVPMDKAFRHGPVECSVQFLCADPRRYSLRAESAALRLATSVGGLTYPLDYSAGLDYGTYTNGSAQALNLGSTDTPVRALFRGPLDTPALRGGDWLLEFDLVLADGESLLVNTDDGSVLLNGVTDRLYTISNRSDPIEACLLPPGSTDLSLTAAAGTGSVAVAYSHARH